MDSFAIELFRQSIFKRDNTLFGSDMQTHRPGQKGNFLKVDGASPSPPKNVIQLNASPELLNRLYDQMNIMAHTQKVRFIAERIEHQHHHVLASSLPFDFFQGGFYSLPKALTNKRHTSP